MATLIGVSAGTPKRTVRADAALWEAYTEACEAEEVTCAEDLRRHMRRKVARYQQKKAAETDGAQNEDV